jgi:hypothetical protein
MPSPAEPTYADRASSPFDEGSFTPSSRYALDQEEEREEEPLLTPPGQFHSINCNAEEEEEENEKLYAGEYDGRYEEARNENDDDIPACPTTMDSGLLVPPSSVMETNDKVEEDLEEEEDLEDVEQMEQPEKLEREMYEDDEVVAEEDEDDAESRIAFLYSQLELKRRQIQRIEDDLSDEDEMQQEETDCTDCTDLGYEVEYEDEDENDGVMLMDEDDMNAMRGEEPGDEADEEELVFAPILQCFYSPRTNMYYEKE